MGGEGSACPTAHGFLASEDGWLCSDETLREAALHGLGIALLPVWLVSDELRDQQLRRMLPDLSGPPAPLHVVHAREHPAQSKLSALLEALTRQCRAETWRPDAGRRST
ncbi:MAG TPA: LysR substrate-binding domain-containing protein [Myxococcaceae bacterium]|nr:LysR substrate-binding domain-containing protein [Myxococcaceae bacterium]